MNSVKEYFAEANAVFVVDQLVKGAIRQFNGTVLSLSGIVGFVPMLEHALSVLRRAIALAATYLDEAILAYVFLDEDENNWRAARDGVVLYAKSWKSVLGSTLLIVLGMYAVEFVGLFALTPLAPVFGNLSPTYEILGWVVVAGLALSVYLGLLRPWVKTVIITTFLVESRNLSPDSETMDRIAGRSSKFQELVANAEADAPDERTTNAPDRDAPEEGQPG